MKTINTLAFFFLALVGFSQNQFAKDFEPIRTELTNWDAVRGEWLASSMEAMAYHRVLPQRTFPEDFTPSELLKLVPSGHRKAINTHIEAASRNATESAQIQAWKDMRNIMQRVDCKLVMARSYGDPHLSTFDGASYSFQTVGEFILAKSTSGNFEIQSRQQPQSDDFSLNTALAMNVNGDRLGIYPNDKPDGDASIFRLNGNPIAVDQNSTYFLPHGGTIRFHKKRYQIMWPTGENMTVDLSPQAFMTFANLSIQIYPCIETEFSGVLGNANGDMNDDFNTRGVRPSSSFISMVSFGDPQAQQISQQVEREHLAYLAKEFASQWRVTMENTLFDYGIGRNTMTYTDLSFPRVHRTLNDMTPDQRTTAQRTCENQGLTGAELRACIYDNGFLNIPPSPRPVVTDHTEGVVLAKIEKPIPVEKTKPNPEPVIDQPVEKPTSDITPDQEKSKGSSGNPAKPTQDQPSKSTNSQPVEEKSKTISLPSLPSSSGKSGNSGSGSTPKLPNNNGGGTNPVKTNPTPVITPSKGIKKGG